MKKLIFSGLLLAVSAFADYTTFVSCTNPGAYCPKGKEIYFGTLEDYQKDRAKAIEAIKKGAASGAIQGLQGAAGALARGFYGEGANIAAGGIGIGILMNLTINPFLDSLNADQEYISIQKVGNELRAVYFVGDKHPSLSAEQIHQIVLSK